MPPLAEISGFLDDLLDVAHVPDYPNALNGVQFGNIGDIEHVATAVDFSSHTIDGAIATGARLLIVHHGMFWGGLQALTGRRHRQIWTLATHDVAVYAAHLPLDIHPKFGNNALLARHLGLTPSGGFARYQTIDVGLSGETDVPTTTLLGRAHDLAHEHGGAAIATPFEPDRRTRRWGICSGAGADTSTLREAERRGIDTLIVGEGPHHTAVEARDADIVVIYGGHYATETLGVRAIGNELTRRFGLDTSFVAAPTGL